jgi:hypothetical protein
MTSSRLSSKLPVQSGWKADLRPRHLLQGRTALNETLDGILSLLSGREHRIATGKFARHSALESIRQALAVRRDYFQSLRIKGISASSGSPAASDTGLLPRVDNSLPRSNRGTKYPRAREIVVNYSPTLVVQGGPNVPEVEGRLLEAIGRSGYELAKILDREYARRARVELL